MDVRSDTSSSSGQFAGQWSFLTNAPRHAQPRSLPASSYIPQSDRSSSSPRLYNGTSGSRSSAPRNLTTASVGGRSASTAPSQPVLIRVHSADASAHLNPAPRPRRPISMNKKKNRLPSISEFSIQGILAAIQEDVESDLNTISEILGRSRFVLADQHDSHMPPTGEIRAPAYSLQSVEETGPSMERLAEDEVFILRDDSSLVDGSQAGSAAYGLLERLQAIPRTSRLNNDTPSQRAQYSPSVPSSPTSPTRSQSFPIANSPSSHETNPRSNGMQHAMRQLMQSYSQSGSGSRATAPVVSEIHLFAGANGVVLDDPFLSVETASNVTPVAPVEDASSDSSAHNNARTVRERVQNLLYVSDPTGLTAWLQGQGAEHHGSGQDAEGHLRGLLRR